MFAPTALISDLVVYVFIGLLGWAAYSDVLTYRIPNRIVLAILALYPAHPRGSVSVGIPGHRRMGGAFQAPKADGPEPATRN